MAVSSLWYGQAFVSAFSGEIDLDVDTIKALLLTSGYVPDQDVHRYLSSITNEVVGTGYTAGGLTLGNPAIGYNGATNQATLTGDDLSWPGSTITARFCVVAKDTGTPATSPLLCLIDFGEDVISSGGPFNINFADGIARVTVI